MFEKYILRMKNITKRFTGVIALKDVDIELKEKEILAVVGENGAGKSTLMKILSGTYPYGTYEGVIEVDGKEQRFHSPRDSENAGIAMIYQEISLELDLSVAENILLGMLPRKKTGLIDWKKAYSEAEKVLETLNLDIDVTLEARNLSASVQQLVCIARALVRNPKILILDEPTSPLTESETRYLMDVLRSLKEKGISCIYISHKLDEVFEIADRALVLRDGMRISVYNKDEFVPEKIVEDMIGRKLNVMFPEKNNAIGEEIFRVEGITVPHPYSPDKNIVENVSFSLRKGEILGLAGLVGAGRSELMKGIFGAMPRSSGKIFMNGKEITVNSPEDAIRNEIGLLTEDRKKDGYVGTMSVRDNMTLTILKSISKHKFIKFKKEEEIVGEYKNALNIKTPSLYASILNLSGGNQQKVLLAKWMVAGLKVLFLDEPTRGVDVGAKAEIYKIMTELAAKGMSIVMTSSELPELMAMCDRFIVLGKGRVQAEISKEDATEAKIMKAAAYID